MENDFGKIPWWIVLLIVVAIIAGFVMIGYGIGEF